MGAIADPPRGYRPAIQHAGGGAWTTVAIVVWLLVLFLALLVAVLALVARRQRTLPLTYVRPRTDRWDRP